MTFSALFGFFGGLFFAAAFLPYIWQTLRGKARPNRAGWFIWAVIGTIICISYLEGNEGTDAMWMPIAGAVGPIVVFVISLWRGEGGWTGFDVSCLGAAGGILCVWWITDSPFLANMGALLVDFAGALPTIRKSWLDPESEDRTAWTLWHTGTWFNLFAVGGWSAMALVYPVYFWLGSGFICFSLWLRPRFLPEAIQQDTSSL